MNKLTNGGRTNKRRKTKKVSKRFFILLVLNKLNN